MSAIYRSQAPPPIPRVMAQTQVIVHSPWRQPRSADGAYVHIERRDLRALTSMRFFAAAYVVLHHLINMALLATDGSDADRDATWLLAWGTQGHVGVTFFFVLSGVILAWCYHEAFARTEPGTDAHRALRRRFWHARWARVWPLHAVMAAAFVPVALHDAGLTLSGVWTTAWQAAANVALVHAWLPVGGADGLADTLNAPSWTLSVEAAMYLAFPFIATALVTRLRWGVGQLATMAVCSWLALGVLGMVLSGVDPAHADWIMRVLPLTRLVDFVIGVACGLILVQRVQQRELRGAQRPPRSTASATTRELLLVAALCAAPLTWVGWGRAHLPATLGVSWWYLPLMACAIFVFADEQGALSRRVLGTSWLVWLGEASFALYLTHLALLLAAYHLGSYERIGVVATSLLVSVTALAVASVVHARFERPVRARLVARYRRRSTMQ